MRFLHWSLAAVLPALAVLLWLGTWQLERRAWKEQLIADVETRAQLAPVALPARGAWDGLDLGAWRYRPVTARGRFDHAREAYVFTSLSTPRGAQGGPGFWVVTPFLLAGGGTVLVNRGFVPEAGRDPATRPEGQVAGEATIAGLVREGEDTGLFIPTPDLEARVFYARDIAAIARADGIADPAPFLIDIGDSAPGGLPQGGETRLSFRNAHLGYAATWYGLAVVLVIIYVASLRARLGAAAAAK